MNGQTFTCFFFFLNDPAPTEIYPLPLHDALPICRQGSGNGDPLALPAAELVREQRSHVGLETNEPEHLVDSLTNRCAREIGVDLERLADDVVQDRKSTRLNSSHDQISYAVFCLKK